MVLCLDYSFLFCTAIVKQALDHQLHSSVLKRTCYEPYSAHQIPIPFKDTTHACLWPPTLTPPTEMTDVKQHPTPPEHVPKIFPP